MEAQTFRKSLRQRGREWEMKIDLYNHQMPKYSECPKSAWNISLEKPVEKIILFLIKDPL